MPYRRLKLSVASMFAVCSALLLGARVAEAHPMPKSVVMLDLVSNGARVELRLPIDRLEIGFGVSLRPNPASRVALLHDALTAYIAKHISATGPDGRAWITTVQRVTLLPDPTAPELIAQVALVAPAGESTRRFTLHYDVIQHQLITHEALISLRSDFELGALAGPPEMLGTIGWNANSIVVNRPSGSEWRGFSSVLRLGMQHIAEGTDHLLFLLVLLLPATLVARNGRWREYAGARRSARHLLGIVTAFTIGHSITLALCASGLFQVRSDIVEILIAVSILVSAVHAIRPLVPGRESLIAAGFGLVHGMAFAGVIAEFHLDAWHMALSIFAFNIGIELMQLFIVLIVAPSLLILARTAVYTPLRVAGALTAAIASVGWIGERAAGLSNPINPLVERAAAQGPWLAAALMVMAIAATLSPRLRRHPVVVESY